MSQKSRKRKRKPTITSLKKHLAPKLVPSNPDLLNFFADFCPPCRSLERNMLPKLKAHFGDMLTIFHVNIEEEKGDKLYWHYANPYGIKGMPYLVFFNAKGKEHGHISGYRPKRIREILNEIFPDNPI